MLIVGSNYGHMDVHCKNFQFDVKKLTKLEIYDQNCLDICIDKQRNGKLLILVFRRLMLVHHKCKDS